MSKTVLTALCALALAGCSTVAEKTNFVSDESIKSQAAGAIGYAPADLTLVTRRTEGTNTYAVLKTKDKKEYACTINGGNLLTMGMTNPPVCNKR
ncbi:hypothetical protein ACSUZJ_23385 [Telluria sp. B2]|jgi:uncharacterized lipoprotein